MTNFPMTHPKTTFSRTLAGKKKFPLHIYMGACYVQNTDVRAEYLVLLKKNKNDRSADLFALTNDRITNSISVQVNVIDR